MLILSRRAGEEICIGHSEVVIRVLRVTRSIVKLGIEAPPSVSVNRGEVEQRDQEGQVDEPKRN